MSRAIENGTTETALLPLEERVRAWEDEYLRASATRSYPALRREPEEDSPVRTPFQRDRDRIVHSKAFRRLKHKTQVFIAPEGDHYRTRLTHTLEASGISRTVARSTASCDWHHAPEGTGRPQPPRQVHATLYIENSFDSIGGRE